MSYILNFQQEILTFKSTVIFWKQRTFIYKRKSHTLALSSPIYSSSVTPIKAIQEINIAISNFMWNNSTSQISQKMLIQSIHNGGLKLCHFETKIQS